MLKNRKHNIYKIIIFIIFAILIYTPVNIKAEDTTKTDPKTEIKLKSSMSGYVETGKKSTSDDHEEDDDDEDYTYTNYHIKFKQKLSDKLSYDISTFIYKKDYDSTDDLDNKARIFKTNWSYYMRKEKEESVKLNFKIQYKEKGYYDSANREYAQIIFSPSIKFKIKDKLSMGISAGINNYDYIEFSPKDERRYFGKIEGNRFLLKKRLNLTGSYRLDRLRKEKIGRTRTKHNLMGGANYNIDKPFFDKISLKVKRGKRNTKELEERDDDSDFEYWKYDAKTEHEINESIKANLKYQYFKKDYSTKDLDHRGIYYENGWDIELQDDKTRRVWFNLDIGQRNVEYIEKSINNYKKTILAIKGNYNKKRNWKTSLGLEGNFYNYENSDNDKKRYYAKLSGERTLLNNDMDISLGLKYRFTDNKEKLDDEQSGLRVGVRYKF